MDFGQDDLFHAFREPNTILSLDSSNLGGVTGVSARKESEKQCRRHRRDWFNLWVGKILWKGNGNMLQFSCLENPMDRGVWKTAVHRVAKSRT